MSFIYVVQLVGVVLGCFGLFRVADMERKFLFLCDDVYGIPKPEPQSSYVLYINFMFFLFAKLFDNWFSIL